jgi:tetratricopeptide (TPR) repeat protein
MYSDSRGLGVTASDSSSVGYLDAAVMSYLGARRDTPLRVETLLKNDPDCILAYCLHGYLSLHAGKLGSVIAAREAHSRAVQIAAVRSVTLREKLHTDALESWIVGDLDRALQHWEAVLREFPLDVLALRLAQFMTSYLGKSAAIRDSVSRVFPSWSESVPGYGFVLGCYAYGLEEAGNYTLAEKFGRQAVEHNASDLWAAHAVTHVMEMRGRPRDGIAWVAGLHQQWAECNNFVFHLWWHQCLFHLALDQFDRVLEVYDFQVRPQSTDEYLDIANAADVLWRLEQAGVSVGNRWEELAQRASSHIQDHLFVFADLHYLLALAARGEAHTIETFIDSCARFAESRCGTESLVMAEVGLAVAQAIVAHRKKDYSGAGDVLLPVHNLIWKTGGSHAQRDVFEQLLIDSVARAGHGALARSLLSERVARRPNDIWGWKNLVAVHAASGDAAGASLARAELSRLLTGDDLRRANL